MIQTVFKILHKSNILCNIVIKVSFGFQMYLKTWQICLHFIIIIVYIQFDQHTNLS